MTKRVQVVEIIISFLCAFYTVYAFLRKLEDLFCLGAIFIDESIKKNIFLKFTQVM